MSDLAAEAQAPNAEVTSTNEGEQPPTSINEAPATGITETPPSAEASEPQTLEDLMAVLNEHGNHTIPIDSDAPQAPVAAETEETEQPTQQPAAETKPQAETEDEDTDERTPKRLRIGNLPPASRTKMAAVYEILREKPELSFEQALAEAGIAPGEKPAAKTEETQPEPEAKKAETPPAVDSSEAIAARIAELNQQRRAALKAYDNEKAVELEEQVEAAQKELTQAQAREAQARDAETQRVQSHQAAVSASVKEASTLYPDVMKEGTPLFNAVAEETARLRESNSPLLQDPEWPIALAAKCAAKLRIAPAAAAPASSAPRPVARPRPAAAPGSVPASPRPQSTAAPAKEPATLEEALAFLNKHGNRTPAAA